MKTDRKPLFILLVICLIVGLLPFTAIPAWADGGESQLFTSIPAQEDGFSAYTVEFGYKGQEYVLPGDSSVVMSEILTTLGLTGEVTAVEISDTSLFSASDESGEWIVTAHQAFDCMEWMKVTILG